MRGSFIARPLALLAALLLAGPAGAQAGASSEAVPGERLLNPLSGIDPAGLEGFLGRPLFSPTRRPSPPPASAPPAPAEAAEAPSSEPPALRLVGILRTPQESVAQLIGADGAQRFSVRLGDFVDGWTVVAIDASTLTLRQGEREASLTIFRGQAAAAEPQAAPAAKPGAQPARKRTWTQEDRKSFFGK